MKREEIVDFKLASILKEYGYDRACQFRIDETDTLYSTGHIIQWNSVRNCVAAPSLSEVSDWILEKTNLFIEITFNEYGDGKYIFSLINVKDGTLLLTSEKTYSTKHKALEYAILALFSKLNKYNKEEKYYKKEEYEPELRKEKVELVN